MPRLLLFLKAPQPGRVKTRLAKGIGAEAACVVFQLLVERQLRALPQDWQVDVHYTPNEELARMQDWLGSTARFIPQCDGDLGARLEYGVANSFEDGADRVFCVGGDCPGLDESALRRADELLLKHGGSVLQESEDGGYVLLGMDAPQPGLFRDIPWSSPETAAATRRKAEQLQVPLQLLPTLYDVDEPEDWVRAQQEFGLQLP